MSLCGNRSPRDVRTHHTGIISEPTTDETRIGSLSLPNSCEQSIQSLYQKMVFCWKGIIPWYCCKDASDFTEIILAAEETLSVHSEQPLQIVDVQQISEPGRRNLLLRITLAPNESSLPQQLIIKQVVTKKYDPDDLASDDTQRFYCDWAGAQFLSELLGDAALSPRFYGGHRGLGFIILEDLGSDHQSLVQPLLEGDATTAETVLLQFAELLGQMHAGTVGKHAEFAKIQTTLHPDLADCPTTFSPTQLPIALIVKNLTRLGYEPNQACQEEIRTIDQLALNPGPFTAYVHLDACPDNFFLKDDKLQIIDFECGRMGHALIDILYARMPFPTCWCCNRLPKALVRKMEEGYRTALATTCFAARDKSRFYQELTMICGYWMLRNLHFLANLKELKNRGWGIATTYPRVLSRLDAFIDASNEFGHLPALHNLAVQLREHLQSQWPKAKPLPLYPAFR